MKNLKVFENFNDESIEDFIDNNRDDLIEIIKKATNKKNYQFDNAEIENWILNDEGLYNWARSEGVDI